MTHHSPALSLCRNLRAGDSLADDVVEHVLPVDHVVQEDGSADGRIGCAGLDDFRSDVRGNIRAPSGPATVAPIRGTSRSIRYIRNIFPK
jgi:hypothetical protein